MLKDYYEQNPAAIDSLRGQIYEEKIIEEIKKKANITNKEITKEEAEKILKQENENNIKEQAKLAKEDGDKKNKKKTDPKKKEVKTKSTGFWRDSDRKEKLPIDERFSYRFFSLEDVFDTLDLSDHELVKIDDYRRIDNWIDYCAFLAENNDIKRPHDVIFSYKEWNEIGYDTPE